jgi:tRNA-specific 2-thiouridylase
VAAGEPLFVVRLDADRRRVIVGPREALLVKRIRLKDASWIGDCGIDAAARMGTAIAVKVRSTRPPKPARLLLDGAIAVDLDEPEEGVAPGQACVFYSPEPAHGRVLGGGWITSTEGLSRPV